MQCFAHIFSGCVVYASIEKMVTPAWEMIIMTHNFFVFMLSFYLFFLVLHDEVLFGTYCLFCTSIK